LREEYSISSERLKALIELLRHVKHLLKDWFVIALSAVEERFRVY